MLYCTTTCYSDISEEGIPFIHTTAAIADPFYLSVEIHQEKTFCCSEAEINVHGGYCFHNGRSLPFGIQSFRGWKLISLVNISACVTVGGLGSC
jgi:hypothetical protein